MNNITDHLNDRTKGRTEKKLVLQMGCKTYKKYVLAGKLRAWLATVKIRFESQSPWVPTVSAECDLQ